MEVDDSAATTEASTSATAGGRPRFEIKKVCTDLPYLLLRLAFIVECCRSMVMGYTGGQLRHLP